MTGACPACTGTDSASACASGNCQWEEEQQRQWLAEEARRYDEEQQAEWERSQHCDQRLMVDP